MNSRYVEEKGSTAMLAVKRLAGVAPELNLNEHVTDTPLPRANKAAHSGFESQRRHYQKSKRGVTVAYKLDLCPSKIKKKTFNRRLYDSYVFMSEVIL